MTDEWGPWRRRGVPPVGAYAQVHARHEETGEEKLLEGFIAGYDDTVGWFTHEGPQDYSDWQATRWRIRKPRGLTLLEGVLQDVETRQPAIPDIT